jgi:protein-disulfide isomerase
MTKKHLKKVAVSSLIASLAAAPQGAAAQNRPTIDSLRLEVEELKQGQMAILSELREIRRNLAPVLRSPRPAPNVNSADGIDISRIGLISLRDEPTKGSTDAPVTVIEFSDYQCPFCARHFRETYPQLDREYVATRRVRYVFHDMPIQSLHPAALAAAEAARCAGDQGKYWLMHDALFEHQSTAQRDSVLVLARGIAGLDVAVFQNCTAARRHAKQVRASIALANSLGLEGTPTFLIAVPDAATGKLRVVSAIYGALQFAAFQRVLDPLIAAATHTQK